MRPPEAKGERLNMKSLYFLSEILSQAWRARTIEAKRNQFLVIGLGLACTLTSRSVRLRGEGCALLHVYAYVHFLGSVSMY